jgi:anti-anti-sigma factor
MERLTRDGLDRLIAQLAERIGDPWVAPAVESGHSLRRTAAHAIRGVEAYLDLLASEPVHPELDVARAQAQELWAFLEHAAALLDRTAAPDIPQPTGAHQVRGSLPMPRGGPAGGGGPSRATLTTARVGHVLVGHLAGELDLESADIFQEIPIEEAAAVVLDLARLDFCDSTGLNALLRLRVDAENRGIRVHLAAPSEQVVRVLGITGTDAVFPVHASIEEALAVLAFD